MDDEHLTRGFFFFHSYSWFGIGGGTAFSTNTIPTQISVFLFGLVNFGCAKSMFSSSSSFSFLL